MIEKTFRLVSIKNDDSDAEYWSTKSPLDCLRASEMLRQEWMKSIKSTDVIEKVVSIKKLHDDSE
jgi:hypothetical protein